MGEFFFEKFAHRVNLFFYHLYHAACDHAHPDLPVDNEIRMYMIASGMIGHDSGATPQYIIAPQRFERYSYCTTSLLESET